MNNTAGTVLSAWSLETQVATPSEAVRVHVIPRDLSAVEGEDGPTLHLLASLNAAPTIKESASVLVVDATGATSPNGAFDALENAARAYPGVRVVGAVTSRNTALVWVRVQPLSVRQPVGYTVHVHAKGGQSQFYASALYGWIRWWLDNLDQGALPVGFPPSVLLPRPPTTVEMVLPDTSAQLSIRHTERVSDQPFEIHDPKDPLYR